MLAATLWRHGSNGAFHDLQQRLLNALARHVACNGRIVRFTADLVDFVDVDDAALGPLDIVVRRLKELQDDVLDVFTDITGFRQRRRVCHRKRHVDDTGKRLRQIGLAATGRTNKKNVGFGQFDFIVFRCVGQPFVVVVHRDRENTLGMVLTDDIIIENSHDFLRRRDAFTGFHHRGFIFLADDVHAQFDAFIADENSRARNQLANFMLTLPAKRAIKRILKSPPPLLTLLIAVSFQYRSRSPGSATSSGGSE